ncbi:bifunctional DNA primase/polymerase [Corynebacterium kalinowskii]|uniref:bifunctional DNA primase/polymerase n=1 Tax=Corynebacterium kalinowskii TaxID=2675216 RepID=UPI0018CDCCE3|nr:bifunctional DNA primase/polymerase [Corynebacterium kalinowskii]
MSLPYDVTAVTTHFKNGLALFPLPAGQKFPPAQGCTGNIPNLTLDEIKKLWDNAPAGCNTGVRVQQIPGTEQEVIILDVDQYDGKQGYESFKRVCGELGLDADQILNSTIRVTRRDSDNPSGHFYFTVVAGHKFQRSCGADVDVIQKGHRYGIAPGSVVDGKEYKCYRGTSDEETTFSLDKAQALPSALFDYLVAGVAGDPELPTGESYGTSKAMQWLTASAPEIDGDLGDIFTSELTGDEPKKFSSEIWQDNNSHDALCAVTRWAIRLAVFEGEPGLKKALGTIRKAFFDRPKSHHATEGEFQRAVTGEVNKVRAEIEKGRKTYLEKTALLEGLDFSTIAGAEQAEKAFSELVGKSVVWLDTLSVGDALAEITALMSPDLISSEGSILNIHTLEEVSKAHLNSQIKNRVRPLLVELRSRFDVDSDNPKESYIGEQVRRAIQLADDGAKRSAQLMQLESALIDAGREVPRSRFNSTPDIIGLPGRQCIDLRLCLEHYRRTGEVDIITRPLGGNEIETRYLKFDVAAGKAAYEKRRAQPKNNLVAGEEFMKVFAPDDRDQQQLWDIFSEVLTKDSRNAVMPWLFGSGGSGKSGFLDMITSSFNETRLGLVDHDLFGKLNSGHLSSRTSGNSHQHSLFVEAGRFAVRLSEVDKNSDAAEAVVKQVLGGGGISAKENGTKRQAVFNSTLIGETNEPPTWNGDSGMRRRIFAFWCDARESDIRAFSRKHHGYEWMTDDDQRYWVLLQLIGGWIRRETGEVDIFNRENDSPMLKEGTERFWSEADPVWQFVKENLVFSEDSRDSLSIVEIEVRARESGLLSRGESFDKATLSALKYHLTELGCEHKLKVPRNGKNATDRRTNRSVGYRNISWRDEPALYLVESA